MIDTMVGLLETCAHSSFYTTSDKLNRLENFLRYRWKIRYNDTK